MLDKAVPRLGMHSVQLHFAVKPKSSCRFSEEGVMSFSLYRCRSGCFVVAPESLKPPLEVWKFYGEPALVNAMPRNLRGAPEWQDLSDLVDAHFYALLPPSDVDFYFDLERTDKALPRTRALLERTVRVASPPVGR
jgi:hypothetical protein